MKKLLQCLPLLLLLLSFARVAPAQRGAWEYLGEANVDGGVDHDNIVVTAAEGRFRAIQIRVERGPIRFDRVIVHYANGQAERIGIRSRIRAGGQSRVIDLPGERRIIQSVEFYYERGRLSGPKPKVRLFGIR